MAPFNRRTAAMLLAFAASANALGAMKYQGCYSSSAPLSKEDSYQYQSSGHCGPLCSSAGQAVAGLTNANECWCGDQMPLASSLVSDSYCSENCTGYSEKCGAAGYFTVWSSGLTDSVTNLAVSSSDTSSSGSTSSTSTTSSTSSPSTVTSISPGNTVVVTVSASASATNTSAPQSSGTNVAGVAAGVVVGVVAVAAIVGGIFFWLRHRRRQQAEEDYKRSAQVQDFMRNSERKAPNTAYSNMSDSRLDPEIGRRNSVGSMADDHDYSRRILRVANPDSP